MLRSNNPYIRAMDPYSMSEWFESTRFFSIAKSQSRGLAVERLVNLLLGR